MTFHSVEITAGPYSWHVVPGDPAAVGDVLDNLRVESNHDEDHPVINAAGPYEARFGILVDRIDELAGLTVGDPVGILAWSDVPGALMPGSTPPAPEYPLTVTAGNPNLTTHSWVNGPDTIAQAGWSDTAGEVLSVYGGHGLAVGDIIRFRDPAAPFAVSLPAGVDESDYYFVKAIHDPEFFTISREPGGAALVLSPDAFRDFVIYKVTKSAAAAHGYSVGDAVFFNSVSFYSSTPPAGFAYYQKYWVTAVNSPNTVQLAATPGGAAITPTTTGDASKYGYLRIENTGLEGNYRPPLIQFAGKVTELNARRRADGRVVVDVNAADHLADLANYTVGTTTYPQELSADRLTRVFNEAGVPVPTFFIYGILAATTEPQPRTLLEAAQEILRWATAETEAEGGFFLVPNYLVYYGPDFDLMEPYALPDPERPYAVAHAGKRLVTQTEANPAYLPLVLVDSPAGWTLDMQPLPVNDLVIDAGLVDLEVGWRKARNKRVDRAVTYGPGVDGNGITFWQEQPNAVPNEFREDTDLVMADNIAALTRLNLPDQAPEQWAIDEIRTVAEFPLDTMLPLFFAGMYNQLALNRLPVYLAGLEPAQDPNGRGWLGGMILNGAIELEGGSYRCEFTLSPEIPLPYNGAGFYSSTPGNRPPFLAPVWFTVAPLDTITYADLDPAVTYYDMRGARRPDSA